MRSFTRFPAVVLGIVIAIAMVVPAIAQTGTPAPVGEKPAGVLGEVQVDGLPTAAGEVWFIRFGLEPDGFIPLGLQIGPTVFVVESGALTIEADQPLVIDGSTAELQSGMQDTVVTGGQTVYVREDTTVSLRNDSGEPVSTLALLVFSGMREVEESKATAGTPQQEPTGFTQMPIGVGQATFPEGPGVVTIERVALDPGAADQTDVPNGAIVGGVEAGSVDISVQRGSCFLWGGMMSISPQGSASMKGPSRTQLQAGDSGALVADDGFGCADPAIAWTAGDQGATIVRAVITPLGAPGAEASPVPIVQEATPLAAEHLPTGVLVEVAVDALPSPDAEVWYGRYSLAPGGSLPPDVQIGPVVAMVESGELTLTSDRPIQIVSGSSTAADAGEAVLKAGDAVYIPEGTTLAGRNDSDQPVVFLMLMTFSPQREVAAMESATPSGEPQGLTPLDLAVTHASFPDGPGVVRLARIPLEPGSELPGATTDGALVGWVEQGGATATVQSGECTILRPVPGGGDVDVEQIGPRSPSGVTSAELKTGDGFGCGNSVVNWQVGPEGMTVLIGEVTPAEAPVATPGS